MHSRERTSSISRAVSDRVEDAMSLCRRASAKCRLHALPLTRFEEREPIMRIVILLLTVICQCGCSGQAETSSPAASNTPEEQIRLEPREREVSGGISDQPSGNPDLSDPNIDTSVMPR